VWINNFESRLNKNTRGNARGNAVVIVNASDG